MRNEIIQLIEKNVSKKTFFLTGDLGFSVLENIKRKLKKNFLNMGVSENNMFLVACGLTIDNKNQIYVYSISPFLILRNLEIIRNYVSTEKRNIKMVGVGSGVSYSTMGKTHFNLDDLNIIYSLKNILILNPANIDELSFVFHKFKNYNYPIYFRINKNSYKKDDQFKKKNNFFIKPGNGKNVIISGAILNYFLKLYKIDEIQDMNIISLPILNEQFNKNIYKYINKNDTLLLCDSSKFIYFQELDKKISILNKNFNTLNFDFNHNKIKGVGDEKEILSQMGFRRSTFDKFFFKY